MAIRTENRCVGCGISCKGNSCSNRNVEVYYCDECDEEISFDEVFRHEGFDLCEACFKTVCEKEL